MIVMTHIRFFVCSPAGCDALAVFQVTSCRGERRRSGRLIGFGRDGVEDEKDADINLRPEPRDDMQPRKFQRVYDTLLHKRRDRAAAAVTAKASRRTISA
ncbi:hypothetical protein VTI28DRAFT_8456 [Corynascus sepedonium]